MTLTIWPTASLFAASSFAMSRGVNVTSLRCSSPSGTVTISGQRNLLPKAIANPQHHFNDLADGKFIRSFFFRDESRRKRHIVALQQPEWHSHDQSTRFELLTTFRCHSDGTLAPFHRLDDSLKTKSRAVRNRLIM